MWGELVVGQGLGKLRRTVSLGAGAVIFLFLLLWQLSASPQTNPAKHANLSGSNRPDIVFVQTPGFAAGPLAQRFPRGSVIVRLGPQPTHSGLVRLTDEFFAAADPQVSFDGMKILFSGEKNLGARWQVWEMNLDGSNKRQVTRCPDDCLRAAYLPADEIVVTVQETKRAYLAVLKTDGSGFHRITFGNAPFALETVLRDGRIVASAPWPLVAEGQEAENRMLYTLRPDGTALESFRCEHRTKAMQADAEELSDGSVTFIQKASGPRMGGALMRVEQGAPGAAPVGDWQAVYETARQLSDTQLVVAKQTRAAPNSPLRFDLYLFNLKTGTVSERLYSDAKLSSVEPVPVLPHVAPKHYWDTLNPESSTGNFISLNSYRSGDLPHGHIATPISRVRVLSLDSADGRERNLGEAPVEEDGSFFVKVPTNAPVRFVLLDARGQIIREQHGWVWTRPGEQRGCTGCHGDKAVAPDNHWPLTLRRFDTPTALGETDHAPANAQAK